MDVKSGNKGSRIAYLRAYLLYDGADSPGLLRGLYKKFARRRLNPRSYYLMLAYMGVNIKYADLVFYSGKPKALTQWRKGKWKRTC